MRHLDQALSREIRTKTKGLPLYQGGPGVDYKGAPHAYAVHILLLHVSGDWTGRAFPVNASALFVQRASGDGEVGSWSGVTGYVDVARDPKGRQLNGFDPIAYAVRNELKEECYFPAAALRRTRLHLGARFQLQSKYTGGTLHVLPVLAIHSGRGRPRLQPNINEVSDLRWVRAGDIPTTSWIPCSFVKHVFPLMQAALR